MHQDRFYISYTPTVHEIWIDGKEAHHILHVKRAKLGSKITLFDGKGIEYLANVTEILDDKLKVFIKQTRKVDRESNVDVAIAFSIPKGKHAIFLIQKCAELGIKTIIPLHCERSIVDIRHKSAEKTEKWNKVVIEASKQCKRNIITEIKDLMLLEDLLKTTRAYDLPLIACTDPYAKSLKSTLGEHPLAKRIICLVGPEGGFTQNEIEIAKNAGYIPISIGRSTLRIETAAIAISSILLYAYSNS